MKIPLFYRAHGIGLFCALQMFNYAFGAINFGAQTSAILIGDFSTLQVASPNNMTVQLGGINRSDRGAISGNPITFDRGLFTSFDSVSNLSGKFDPTGGGTVILGTNPDPNAVDIMLANPGGFPHQFLAQPGIPFLRGDPLFLNPNAIVLADSNTELAIALQNTLNTAITMNGGTLFLEDDLRFGNQGVLLGNGVVDFNGRRLSLGGAESVWNGLIQWESANDLLLNSQTTLNGIWVFDGDSQINGNGNVLDISNGGIIAVTNGSTLRLSGVSLKGLGLGGLFMGNGAELFLSDSNIEMNTDYTVDSGGIYVDGDSTIITQNHLFTIADSMDSHGSLTVDTCALTYDTQNFLDNTNIRPQQINDPAHKFINIINNGSIRRIRQEPITFLNYSAGSAVQRYAVISPQRNLLIFPQIDAMSQLQYDFTIDGAFNFFGFTPANNPIMFVSDKVNVKYKNVYFREFSPVHLSLGKDATLIWGNNSTVSFIRDETLNYPFLFEGNTVLNGQGKILTLEAGGEIVLKGAHSTLLIDSVVIKNLSGVKIRCEEPSSTIIFKDVTIYQDGDFNFSVGAIEVLNNLTLIGPGSFNYEAVGPFRILSNSTFSLARQKIFRYVPTNGNRTLLQMADASSTITMDNSTIYAPAPGFQLLNGLFVFTNNNFFQNPGNPNRNINDGIVFGNGHLANNVVIQQAGGSTLTVGPGVFTNEDV